MPLKSNRIGGKPPVVGKEEPPKGSLLQKVFAT